MAMRYRGRSLSRLSRLSANRVFWRRRVIDAILSVLAEHRPDVTPGRAETIAQAIAAAEREFPEHPMLAATLLTALEQESNFSEAVQLGIVRGRAGEICMTQIHPVNGFWRGYVAKFEDLAGLSLEATTACFLTAAKTLSYSRAQCLRQNYRRNWAQAMWTRYHYGSRCWLSPHAHKRTIRMLHWNALLRKKNETP